MSRNRESAAAMYAAFKRGDIDFIFAGLDENVEWVFQGDPGQIPWAGSYRGIDGVREFFGKLAGNSSQHELVNVDWVDGGEKVVALGSFNAVASTGRPFSFNWAHVWTFNSSGKAVRFVDYTDTQVQAAAFASASAQAGA
jgi:ketosteroid isomerase-like protein